MCFTFLIEIIFSEIFIRAISVTGFYLIEIFERLEINSSLFKISFHHLYFIHCEHLWLQNAENYFLSLTRTILSLLNSVGGQARCIDLHIRVSIHVCLSLCKVRNTLILCPSNRSWNICTNNIYSVLKSNILTKKEIYNLNVLIELGWKSTPSR